MLWWKCRTFQGLHNYGDLKFTLVGCLNDQYYIYWDQQINQDETDSETRMPKILQIAI